MFVTKPPKDEQITAILGPDPLGWAVRWLPASVSIDDVRFRDLVSVTEDDVWSRVMDHGFDDRVVADGAVVDDRLCIVAVEHGWRVLYSERGNVSEEAVFPTRDEARREVIRRLMRLARILLNHRYWHTHQLAFPCGDE